VSSSSGYLCVLGRSFGSRLKRGRETVDADLVSPSLRSFAFLSRLSVLLPRAMSVFQTMDALGYTTILSANLNQTISHHHLFAPWVKGEQPSRLSRRASNQAQFSFLLPQSSSSRQKTLSSASNLQPASNSLPTTLWGYLYGRSRPFTSGALLIILSVQSGRFRLNHHLIGIKESPISIWDTRYNLHARR